MIIDRSGVFEFRVKLTEAEFRQLVDAATEDTCNVEAVLLEIVNIGRDKFFQP